MWTIDKLLSGRHLPGGHLPGKLRAARSWTARSWAARPWAQLPPATPDGIAEQFDDALQEGRPDDAPELLPVRLAQACVAVLPVSGAAISLLYDDFRVPLGASDDAASCAERLQFTTGQGPCLDAVRNRDTVLADREQILDSWPEYGQELFARTPYDAVISLPLTIVGEASGALDLFLRDQSMADRVSLADVSTVRSQIVAAFQRAGMTEQNLSGQPEPAWLHGPSAQDRTHVWIAMGMVMNRFELVAADALALLRAHAYGTGSTLDQLAEELISGRQELAQLQP
jgi:hypothetical protein